MKHDVTASRTNYRLKLAGMREQIAARPVTLINEPLQCQASLISIPV